MTAEPQVWQKSPWVNQRRLRNLLRRPWNPQGPQKRPWGPTDAAGTQGFIEEALRPTEGAVGPKDVAARPMGSSDEATGPTRSPWDHQARSKEPRGTNERGFLRKMRAYLVELSQKLRLLLDIRRR
jgi:hypothetical protein